MKLRDIMTSSVSCASPMDSVLKVASDMKRHNVGVMPVCESGKLVGLITDRDIVIECVASGVDPKNCRVGEFMTGGLVVASPEMDVVEAAHLMGGEQIHRLPVVENDFLVGMVSIGDIALHCGDDKVVAQMLREISVPIRSVKMEVAA